MSDTKLKAKLPEGDANGLKGDAWRKTLVESPRRPRVAIVVFDVDSINKTLDDNLEVPSVRLQAIEPITDEFEEKRLIKQLQNSQGARAGSTPLDMPDDEKDPEYPAYGFELRALPAGRVGLYMFADGIEVGKQGGLKGAEFIPPTGAIWSFAEVPVTLRSIAEDLIRSWEGTPAEVESDDDGSDGDDAA